MKKLSLLMALAMIITIGGVYANWVYHEGVMSTEVHDHFSIKMAGVESENAKGVLTVDAGGLVIEVINSGSYVPELSMSGSVKVYFKPNAGVSPEAERGELDLAFKLSASRGGGKLENVAYDITYTYEDYTTEVFSKYDQDVHDVTDTAEKNDQGVWVFEIPASEIEQLIVLNEAGLSGDNALDSFAKFKAFEQAINSQSFGISVWEKAA